MCGLGSPRFLELIIYSIVDIVSVCCRSFPTTAREGGEIVHLGSKAQMNCQAMYMQFCHAYRGI